MELDDMKQLWQALDHRLGTLSDLERKNLRAVRLNRLNATLRPLALGQMALMMLGIGIALWGGDFWFTHLTIWQAVICGVVMQAFGILGIIFPARILAFIYGIDYAAPVVETQRHLAQLRAWRVKVEARVFGVLGAVIWIPGLLMVFQYAMDGAGVNEWGAMSDVLPWLAASIVGSAAIAVLLYWGVIKLGFRRRMEDSFAGNSIQRAEAELLEITRFELE